MVLTWRLATPDEPMAVFVARALLIGAFAAGAHLYGQSMLMDTFAWDYKLTGVRREGVLSAAFSFVEKACLALGPLIVGFGHLQNQGTGTNGSQSLPGVWCLIAFFFCNQQADNPVSAHGLID